MTDTSTDRESVEALHKLVTIDAVNSEIDRQLAGRICSTLLALLAERDALEAKLAEARVPVVKPLAEPITVQQAARRLLEAGAMASVYDACERASCKVYKFKAVLQQFTAIAEARAKIEAEKGEA